jgi:ABC-2 type transport system permease protein
MNLKRVGALVAKDTVLYFSNRFVAVITVLGFALYLLVYFLMPSTVDETLRIGLYAPGLPVHQQSEQGLEATVLPSAAEVRGGVLEGRFAAGLALEAATGRVTAWLPAEAPVELRESIGILAAELALALTGHPLPVRFEEEVIGPDMTGRQVPPRDRLRPLIAVFLLLVEMLGLANLITDEVERRTLTALRVTPMTVGEFYLGKGIVGVGLAFVQSVLYLGIVGGLRSHPLLLVAALLLGSMLVTSAGFLLASVGHDFFSIMGWGILVMVAFAFPTFTVLFPGSLSGWVKAIPSYWLVDIVNRVTGYGAGWAQTGGSLLALLGFDAALAAAGIAALNLKRKMA